MGPARFAVAATVVVAASAALVALATPSGDGPAPPTPAPCSPGALAAAASPGVLPWRTGTVGAAGGVSFPGDVLVEDDDILARQLDGVAEAGARWVRVDLDWSFIEPEQGRFDWCRSDRFIAAARGRGLDVVAILTYAPGWATGSTSRKAGPLDPADFAAFAAAAVERYAAVGVHAWEVWNEPNIAAFWFPQPDVAAYARLLHAAAPAIRAADPLGTVISAGLAPAPDSDDGRFVHPETFLRALYAEGAANDFDAVGYHPYSFPSRPLENENAFSRLPDVHQLLVEHGDGDKQLWLTEFGAPTGLTMRAVAEEVQADILAEGYEAIVAWPWVGPMLWYAYRDLGTDPTDVGQNFGLVRADFEPKPALDAFADAMATETGP